jgi:hypothetical protein
MTPCDPMAVAVDWLDAYRDASLDQIIAMYSPRRSDRVRLWRPEDHIQGAEGISAYWPHRAFQVPALELEELQMDGGAVVVSYRTSSGIVQALLDTSVDGLITRCRCTPIWEDSPLASAGLSCCYPG